MAKKTPKPKPQPQKKRLKPSRLKTPTKTFKRRLLTSIPKMSLQRLKSRLKSPRIPRKSPIFSREWQRESRALFPNLKKSLGRREKKSAKIPQSFLPSSCSSSSFSLRQITCSEVSSTYLSQKTANGHSFSLSKQRGLYGKYGTTKMVRRSHVFRL